MPEKTQAQKDRDKKFVWEDGDIIWTKPPKLNKPAAKAKKTSKKPTK